MKYFNALKTSERISLSFAFFGFVSLLVFLILINVTYFFIWYSDRKEASFSEVNDSYVGFLESEGAADDTYNFKQYLLDQDTIIIPDMGELICSPGVASKIKEDPSQIQDQLFYHDGETLYFIYSRYFEGIGDVKIFYDTTSYIETQITIIKTGFAFMFLVFLLQFFAGKYISRWLLRDLKNIGEKLKVIDIHSSEKNIVCDCLPPDDEIRILAEALNSSYDTIDIQTSKLKQFLTDVSHEFKTPLMALSSRLDLMDKKISKDKLQPKDIQKHIGDTRKNISQLNGLLESLFFLSRIEENTGCLVKTDINVEEFLSSKLKNISESFPEKQLSYKLDIQKNLIYKAETNTFSILVDNLLTNAMKFSPENIEIIIRADENGFYIQDNGPGISGDAKDRIWEKFYRTDTNKEGFGVGLYLVKRIVELHEWNIYVVEGSHKGARFKVNLSRDNYSDSNPS